MPLTPETWRDEQVVNSNGAGLQNDIVQLSNGNILVSWTTTSNSGAGSPIARDIVGQIFDPLGEPVGAEFLLNTTWSEDLELEMQLAATDDGGFIGVYKDIGSLGNAIRLQVYDSAGSSSLSSSYTILENSDGRHTLNVPNIAVSSPTSALIVTQEAFSRGGHTTGRILNPETQTMSSEMRLLDNTSEFAAEVTVLENGNYVISAAGFINGFSQITYKIVTNTGNFVTDQKRISSTLGEVADNELPSLTALAGGGFVIAWQNDDGTDIDGMFQIFNADGTAVDEARTIEPGGNTDKDSQQEVIGLNDGGFAIFYRDNETGEKGLKVERYDPLGNQLGNNVLFSASNASNISAIALEDGRMAVSWSQSGEVQMEILDIRDAVNDPAYTGHLQIGTVGADIFIVDDAAESVHGWDGDDKIYGTANADLIFGDAGDDLLLGKDGDDSINGGDGADIIGGDEGADTIHGDGGNDSLFGNNGDDFVFGDDGNDGIYGGAGNDTLYGGLGDDYMRGQDGDDLMNGEAGNDTMLGDNGNDTLYGNGGYDILGGGAGNDLLDGGGGNDKLYGGSGDDEMIGGDGNDLLLGYTGDDTLKGGSGIDILGGGDGFDDVRGGSGDDSLFGNNGDDWLWGDDGDDSLYGGRGDDLLHGGAGDDTLLGQTGNDILYGNDGNDVLGGFDGDDKLYGNAGDDAVFGNAGDDILFGNAGDDAIYGGAGNDALNGNIGNDALYGQGGSDTFVFENNYGTDVIFDFAKDGLEKIDLSAVTNITDFTDLSANHIGTTVNGDLFIGDGLNTVTIQGYGMSDLDANDFLF